MSDIDKLYGDWDEESATKEASAAEDLFGASVKKLAEGRNVLRILPPPPGARSPFLVVHLHYVKDVVADQIKKVVVCPAKMTGGKERCPICEAITKLRESGNYHDAQIADAMAPQVNIYVTAVNRAREEEGPAIYRLSYGVYKDLLDKRKDSALGGNFAHPMDGYDVVIRKSGSGMGTRYVVDLARQASALSADEDEIAEWLEYRPDMSSLARLPDRALMQDAMMEFRALTGGGEPPRPALPRGESDRPAPTRRGGVVEADLVQDGDDLPY